MEIRTAKKKKIAPTSLGIMDDVLVDTVHNIRMKSNDFRDFGKSIKSNLFFQKDALSYKSRTNSCSTSWCPFLMESKYVAFFLTY